MLESTAGIKLIFLYSRLAHFKGYVQEIFYKFDNLMTKQIFQFIVFLHSQIQSLTER